MALKEGHMDQRKVTLLRSVVSLVAVVALGGGVTYALFTSNTVTLGATQVTTGNADLRICNVAGTNDWKDVINPALNVGDLVPGVEKQITNTGDIHLGNDNGTLATVFGDTRCDSYAVPAGSSDVAFKVNPQLPGPAACTDTTLNDTLRLKFKI